MAQKTPKIHPAGTKLTEIKRWDRGTKVAFTCPEHGGAWRSKDPWSSSWFGPGQPCHCSIHQFTTTHEYQEPSND